MSLLHCLSLPLWVNFEFPLWVEVNFVSWHQNSEYHSHWVFAASPQIPEKTYFPPQYCFSASDSECVCVCVFLSLSLLWCEVTHVCQLHLFLKRSFFVLKRPWAVGKVLNNKTYYCLLLLLYETVTVWVRLIHCFFLLWFCNLWA